MKRTSQHKTMLLWSLALLLVGLACRISVGSGEKRASEPTLDLERLQSHDRMRLQVQFSGGLLYRQQIAEGLEWDGESFYGESSQEDYHDGRIQRSHRTVISGQVVDGGKAIDLELVSESTRYQYRRPSLGSAEQVLSLKMIDTGHVVLQGVPINKYWLENEQSNTLVSVDVEPKDLDQYIKKFELLAIHEVIDAPGMTGSREETALDREQGVAIRVFLDWDR